MGRASGQWYCTAWPLSDLILSHRHVAPCGMAWHDTVKQGKEGPVGCVCAAAEGCGVDCRVLLGIITPDQSRTLEVPRDDEISFIGYCTCHSLSPYEFLVVKTLLRQVLHCHSRWPPSCEEDNKQANQFEDHCSTTSFIMLLFLTPHAPTPPFHEITNSSTRWVSSLVLSASQPVMGSVCIKLRLRIVPR